jgi:hypothetical protein
MTFSGMLNGGTVRPLVRIGDLSNGISIGTGASYYARALFKEHVPYYREYDANGVLTIFPTYHFIKEVRRHLSGEVGVEEEGFSDEEKMFFQQYCDWSDNLISPTGGEMLLALETLDKWLMDEVGYKDHPEISREYESWHPWMKPGKEENN